MKLTSNEDEFLKLKMSQEKEQSFLEPMIAHGSRMSWAGILRPGDEFTPARKSQLAVMRAESGPPLKRCFGKWSEAYHRFTTNLTSPRIKVTALNASQKPIDGIPCILHWVDRGDMIRTDRGSVCYGDGWPKELWNAFISELHNLPDGTIAEKFRNFLNSNLQGSNDFVSQWRKRLADAILVLSEEQSEIDQSWLPVPATLVVDGNTSECIVSWSPGAIFYQNLSEALASPEAIRKKPDLVNQAKYYLECVLAKFHGVSFDNPNDFLEDQGYALSPEVQRIQDSFAKLEKERIRDTRFGRLDRFGF